MQSPFNWSLFRVALLVPQLLIAPWAVVEAAAQGEQVTGRINSFVFVTPSGDATTSSTTLVPMPGTAVTFTSQRAGSALIQFCGKSSPADIVLVEARADGVPAPPNEIVLDAAAATEIPAFTTHCFNWAVADLPRGSHEVDMMFRSLEGREITIQDRSLTVLFR
jgi:hypothetical protein